MNFPEGVSPETELEDIGKGLGLAGLSGAGIAGDRVGRCW